MLPKECSKLQTANSAWKAIFSLKEMIKMETSSGGNYEVTYWSCSNPMATMCDSLQVLAYISGKLEGLF